MYMWSRASVCVCVCLSVCLSVRGRTPTLLHGPRCNLGHGRGCPLVVHYWADLQSGHGLRCYGNITRTLVASIPRYDDIVRMAGCAGSVRAAGRRRGAPPKPRPGYGKRARPARRRWGHSQHYCGSLDCRLPLVAFWQQKANAKCLRVHACTRSMPGCSLY